MGTAPADEQQVRAGVEVISAVIPSGVTAPVPASTAGTPAAQRTQDADAGGGRGRDRGCEETAGAAPPQGGAADADPNATAAEASQRQRLDELEAQVQRQKAKRQRNKAAAKARLVAKREQVTRYVEQQYGDESTPMTKVQCPLWSSAPDLKMAFTKLTGEVTARSAAQARMEGLSTREVHLMFGGSRYSASVLSGTVAVEMTATERSLDLLVLLSDGLTPERIETLIRRWSKRVSAAVHMQREERSMDDEG